MVVDKKLVVGIDIDGTLADTMDRWLYYYKKDFNVEVSKEDLFVYNFSKIFPGVNKDIMRKYFEKVWEDWKEVKLIDSLPIKNISILKNIYEIRIITSTWGDFYNVKKWVDYNEIYYDSIIYVENPLEKRKKCDILIDDNLDNVNSMYEEKKIGILFEQPWNKKNLTEKIKEYVLACDNWTEVIELLKDIYNNKYFYTKLQENKEK